MGKVLGERAGELRKKMHLFFAPLSLYSEHPVLTDKGFPVFRHFFGGNIIELQNPFDQFIGYCFFTREMQVCHFLKDPVEPVDTGILAVNGDLLDLDLVRGNAPADRAVVPILIVPDHAWITPDTPIIVVPAKNAAGIFFNFFASSRTEIAPDHPEYRIIREKTQKATPLFPSNPPAFVFVPCSSPAYLGFALMQKSSGKLLTNGQETCERDD
jgi:hypothetical protein